MTVTVKSVERYVEGSNNRLDSINDGKRVWIVQGNIGRRPIIAETADEAEDVYKSKKRPIIED